jgi:two-component system sensor histidine kinase HydH
MIFVAYEFAALRRGERIIFTGGGLVFAALALAFAILLFLARKLDAYREREARDRELVALGEAARTLAHEIKNPLGVIKIQCALLKRGGTEGSLPNLRVIEEETDRLALLADHVRLFLSGGEGRPELIRVAHYLSLFADRYAGTIRLIGNIGDDVSLFVDRGRLDQILDNLVANARESMDAAPAVQVELSASLLRGSLVSISVADRGHGIPAEDAERVFDLFYTTKTTGSGLGLATARRFAEAAGGTLTHEAREGGGTIFSLMLPAARGKRGAE